MLQQNLYKILIDGIWDQVDLSHTESYMYTFITAAQAQQKEKRLIKYTLYYKYRFKS